MGEVKIKVEVKVKMSSQMALNDIENEQMLYLQSFGDISILFLYFQNRFILTSFSLLFTYNNKPNRTSQHPLTIIEADTGPTTPNHKTKGYNYENSEIEVISEETQLIKRTN